MPPEVLGNPMDTSPAEDEPPKHQRRPSTIADVNQRARKKRNFAIKSANSQAAVAAAAEILQQKQHLKAHQLDGSMFTMLTYRGMEVLFSTTHQNRLQLVGLCSRTRQIFQTLSLPCKEPIVSITSNSYTGMLIVAHHDGTIQTYTPIPTCPGDPELDSNPSHPKAAFGRYRWVNGPLLRPQEIFYQASETPNFADRRSAKPGHLLEISTSYDHKLLVAHRNQLAVFDVMPLHLLSDDPNSQPSSTDQAKLLWTTLLQAKIVTAKISGDGQAIVVVMADQESEYTAATFIHDTEDGSNPTLMNPPTLERNISVGMVYRHNWKIKEMIFCSPIVPKIALSEYLTKIAGSSSCYGRHHPTVGQIGLEENRLSASETWNPKKRSNRQDPNHSVAKTVGYPWIPCPMEPVASIQL
jgi:hypothetical protein